MFDDDNYNLMGDADSLYDQYDLQTDQIVITDSMLNGIAEEDEYDKLLSISGISLAELEGDTADARVSAIGELSASEDNNQSAEKHDNSLQAHINCLLEQLRSSRIFPSYLTKLWIAALESVDYKNSEQALSILDEVYQQFSNVCSCYTGQPEEYSIGDADSDTLVAEKRVIKNECSWVSYLLKSKQGNDGKSSLDRVVAF